MSKCKSSILSEDEPAYMLEAMFFSMVISREVVYNGRMRPSILIPVSKVQREIIIGNILGDGSLEFNGNVGTRLQIKQSFKHKEYVMWLYEKLKNLCSTKPKQREDNKQWYFSTRALKELTALHRLFYSQGRKRISRNISELLISSLSLAVWYMDDGSLDYRPKDHYAFVLSTDSFSLKEVWVLSKTIKRNFGINTSVYNSLCRNKRYPKIYIGSEGRDKFLSLIKPYILNCFSHKLLPL